MQKNFSASNWKEYIPHPIYDEHPEYEDFYIKAWELAHDHIKSIEGMPQSPYMDEAFCNTQIWIWDTCFMAQFCKFAASVFPGIESFSNFYEVLYGEKSLPKILTDEKEPAWAHAIPGRENNIYIHIADNPPLFAWVELENAKWSKDTSRIKELLYEKQFLQKHYHWLEGLKAQEKPRGVFNKTCLISEEIGYRWEGGRSGMDNTPRGRQKIHEDTERPNNPDLLWIDAVCQQALAARSIGDLFELAGDKASAAEWNKRYLDKKEIVNKYYWDEKDKFYYDININTKEFCKVKTIASYWTLTAGIASENQARALVELLSDENTFGGSVPLISLARGDGDYHSDGRYWRGGLWLPTAYAALRGISDYGYLREARAAAEKIFLHMQKTYREFEPHTIWECYSPEEPMPARTAGGNGFVRPDFCGWSALGPISIYLEYVLGFYSVDAFKRRIKWLKPQISTGEAGIKNLSFGGITTDIIASKTSLRVTSNEDYTLTVDGVNYDIKAGENEFTFY